MEKNLQQEILEASRELKVEFVRLQFTDIFGIIKNVAIPVDQLQKALQGGLMFDGSSIEGFARVEESDMYLIPDPATFKVYPWKAGEGVMARLICDVYTADRKPFQGCPRQALKNVVRETREQGYEMFVGSEMEFFLFNTEAGGEPTVITHDQAGYFDLNPIDHGEAARRKIVLTLKEMGFPIESAHHEASPGQHEINIRYADALAMADQMVTVRFLIKATAQRYGLHATFMAKPKGDMNGSGMHYNQSLFKKGRNVFWDESSETGLSPMALKYMAGIMRHAPAITAITNPTVNSYKRLVSGFHAPVSISWSRSNRSSLIRIPAVKGDAMRIELRSPDPMSNPYLALAVMLKAGLTGMHQEILPPPEVRQNLYQIPPAGKEERVAARLPRTLREALSELEKDSLVRGVLGEHIYSSFIRAKENEWERYHTQVHPWELDEYLTRY